MGLIFFTVSTILSAFFGQFNKGGGDLWLAYWSEDKNQKQTEKEPMKKWVFFIVLSILNLFSSFFMFLRILLTRSGSIRLGRSLHKI